LSNIRTGTISGVNGTDPVTLTKQSAAKMFAIADQSALTVIDSLNTSSITDMATGRLQFNLTNNMANTKYCIADSHLHYGGVTYQTACSIGDGTSAAYFQLVTYRVESATFYDSLKLCGQTTGDLA
jgi:hypothetical protein